MSGRAELDAFFAKAEYLTEYLTEDSGQVLPRIPAGVVWTFGHARSEPCAADRARNWRGVQPGVVIFDEAMPE